MRIGGIGTQNAFNRNIKSEVNGLPNLIGSYNQLMDIRGRMSFPIKLREILGEQFYVTRGMGGCLFAFSEEDFNILSDRINALPLSKGINLRRFFISWAEKVTVDKQGRILITQNLRSFAGLDKEIVVTGVGDRAEIWDKSRWDEFNNSINENEIMQCMEELDF